MRIFLILLLINIQVLMFSQEKLGRIGMVEGRALITREDKELDVVPEIK